MNPVAKLASQGATLLINTSASPFDVGKERLRYELIQRHATRHRLPFLYVNQVGANDELIFDGRSFLLNASGQPLAVLPSFAEAVRIVDTKAMATELMYPVEEEIATLHDALVLGIRDYALKCGFKRAAVALSSGIDSALTFYLAVRALGSEKGQRSCLA